MSEVKRILWLLKIPFVSKFVGWRQLRKTAKLSAQLEKDVRRACDLLKSTQKIMIELGWPRWKRKQFRNDLIKHDEVADDVYAELKKFYLSGDNKVEEKLLTEGNVKKGGVNSPPNQPRPADPPKGQGKEM